MKKNLTGRPGDKTVLALLIAVLLMPACAAMPPPGGSPADASNPVSMMIHLYRGPLDHLNALRGGECPMFPSCSHYGLAAVEKHGPVVGYLMACDRLIRCGRDEITYALKIPVNGKWRYHDPVAANDFWFSSNPDPLQIE